MAHDATPSRTPPDDGNSSGLSGRSSDWEEAGRGERLSASPPAGVGSPASDDRMRALQESSRRIRKLQVRSRWARVCAAFQDHTL